MEEYCERARRAMKDILCIRYQTSFVLTHAWMLYMLYYKMRDVQI